MNIYEKLQSARVKLQELNLHRSEKSKLGFNYYALGDFMPSVNRLFAELKLCSVYLEEQDKASLEIINAEKPEERVVFTVNSTSFEAKYDLYLNVLEIMKWDTAVDTSASDIEF